MDEPTKNRVWELLGAGLDCPAVARSLGMGVTSVRELEANAGGVRPRPRLRSSSDTVPASPVFCRAPSLPPGRCGGRCGYPEGKHASRTRGWTHH